MSGLGKGLSAILSDNAQLGQDALDINEKGLAASQTVVLGSIAQIPVAEIETNPFQPRTEFDQVALSELAESIKVQGIIQPITVRQLSANQYQLISGERRFQASKLIGLETIPAYIRTANDQQMLEMALIENIQRENLNPIEIALSYQRLISEINLKQEELGERVGKNRSTVTNYLRLLRLPPDIQAGLRDRKISMGHAKALVNLERSDMQLQIYNQILSFDLSVRKVEDLVREIHLKGVGKNNEAKTSAPTANGNYLVELQNVQSSLSNQFSTKVTIKAGPNNSGEIKIPFTNTEDLNRILELLNYQA